MIDLTFDADEVNFLIKALGAAAVVLRDRDVPLIDDMIDKITDAVRSRED